MPMLTVRAAHAWFRSNRWSPTRAGARAGSTAGGLRPGSRTAFWDCCRTIIGAAEAAEIEFWDTLGELEPVERTEFGGAAPRWWREAVDLLEAGACRAVSVAAVAQQVGVHPVHLARVCRRELGCTVRQYLRRQRVLAAWRACECGEKSLVEIAAATGFADQAHMSRSFGRELGISPARLARLVRDSA